MLGRRYIAQDRAERGCGWNARLAEPSVWSSCERCGVSDRECVDKSQQERPGQEGALVKRGTRAEEQGTTADMVDIGCCRVCRFAQSVVGPDVDPVSIPCEANRLAWCGANRDNQRQTAHGMATMLRLTSRDNDESIVAAALSRIDVQNTELKICAVVNRSTTGTQPLWSGQGCLRPFASRT